MNKWNVLTEAFLIGTCKQDLNCEELSSRAMHNVLILYPTNKSLVLSLRKPWQNEGWLFKAIGKDGPRRMDKINPISKTTFPF